MILVLKLKTEQHLPAHKYNKSNSTCSSVYKCTYILYNASRTKCTYTQSCITCIVQFTYCKKLLALKLKTDQHQHTNTTIANSSSMYKCLRTVYTHVVRTSVRTRTYNLHTVYTSLTTVVSCTQNTQCKVYSVRVYRQCALKVELNCTNNLHSLIQNASASERSCP